jgi:hypothetical protein
LSAAHVERIRAEARATSSTMLSMIIIPWGAPKPRKAVLETVWVLQRCETSSRCSRKYALSKWQTARSFTAAERSSE